MIVYLTFETNMPLTKIQPLYL